MMTKPMKTLGLRYPMIQSLITADIDNAYACTTLGTEIILNFSQN